MGASKVMVVTAVGVLCISVLLSAYFSRSRKLEMKKMSEEASRSMPREKGSPNSQMPPPTQRNKPSDNQKTKRGGWASVMLPFYSLGILAYVMYVVGKIMSKKYSDTRKNSQFKVSWNKERRPKGKAKTKITMHEIQQLERKLQETEAAVQQIFTQTCQAVKAANKALESSSDEEFSARPMKRLKKVTNTESSSTDEESNSDDHAAPKKLKSNRQAPSTQLRKRRVQRARKVFRDSREMPSSDSESANPISVRKINDSCSSTEETEFLTRSNDAQNTCTESDDTAHEEDLVQTAKNIRQTMSELQSYVDDKKTELGANG